MTTHEQSITIDRPVRNVYNQWTQFEAFPNFMEGVETITQLSATRNHWVTKTAGVTREFDTEITEQIADERIAWKSLEGSSHAGVVTFHRLDDTHTRVMLQMDFDPEGVVETAGDKMGVVGHRLKGDMQRFKAFIEAQPAETGAWRGEVPQKSN